VVSLRDAGFWAAVLLLAAGVYCAVFALLELAVRGRVSW